MTKSGSQINLAQFNAVFLEECEEHLQEMERILVSLDSEKPDQEELNAVFRAAHSIKGGAGIFGFDDILEVTHLLESLLDKVRTFEREYSPAMTDTFLEARDVIALQLDVHRSGAEVPAAAVEKICRTLQNLIEQEGHPAAATTQQPSLEAEAAGVSRNVEIVFTPGEDLFLRGVRIEGLVQELEELGQMDTVAAISVPEDFDAFNPENCCSSWRFRLTTTATDDEIKEVFIFAADDKQLSVVARPDPLQEQPTEDGAELPVPVDCTVTGRRAYDRDETAPGAFGRRAGEADASIRVSVAKADQLMNQVGELVITQSMLAQIAATLDSVTFESLHRNLQQLERNTRDLQRSVMSIRLVPISIVFNRFPRMVRELAAKLGKKVDLRVVGETTELDRGLIEKITDPLTHLLRNSLDHGVETPDARVAAGKDATGTVTLRASQTGGRIVIDVMDDGAGLDREKILCKARSRGIHVDDKMPDEEVWQLIFAPGFSTAETVTDVSGRGVGMDVVQKNVQALSGRIQIFSEPGKGTRITISLPLTLAILDGLSVAVGSHRFIIPLNSIIESLQPSPEAVRTINGMQVVHVRGEYFPVLPLCHMFNIETDIRNPHEGIVVLASVEGEQAAILVDALLDEHQVVIKSLEDNYRKVPGAAGATILGDGRVALILDVSALLQMRKNETIGRHGAAGEVAAYE